ncbi:MAG: hypothetical protein VB125_00875 [Burkholderia sp.]
MLVRSPSPYCLRSKTWESLRPYVRFMQQRHIRQHMHSGPDLCNNAPRRPKMLIGGRPKRRGPL